MAFIDQGHISITYIDQSAKASVQRLAATTVTVANFTAQQTAYGNLLTATDALSAGVRSKSLWGNLTSNSSPVPPAPPASRSNKFAVTYIDTTSGDTYTTQIPVANPSAVTFLAGTRLLDPSMTPYSTYITAFQAVVQSEEGHAVTIKQARWVGRHI